MHCHGDINGNQGLNCKLYWDQGILLIWQVQILDFAEQTLGLEAESCQCSKAESCEKCELFVAGKQGSLKGHGSFGFSNAQICILPHFRDAFSLIADMKFIVTQGKGTLVLKFNKSPLLCNKP